MQSWPSSDRNELGVVFAAAAATLVVCALAEIFVNNVIRDNVFTLHNL